MNSLTKEDFISFTFNNKKVICGHCFTRGHNKGRYCGLELKDEYEYDIHIHLCFNHIRKNSRPKEIIKEVIEDRMKTINKDGVLLEIYMKKMMHPNKLKELTENEDIDVDEFMEKYVKSL